MRIRRRTEEGAHERYCRIAAEDRRVNRSGPGEGHPSANFLQTWHRHQNLLHRSRIVPFLFDSI